MLSLAESNFLLELMKKDFEKHIDTIDLVKERLNLLINVPTLELVDELCRRVGVVEYKHGENTYFEIVKYDKPGVSGNDRVINSYKIIDEKDRILVIKEVCK